MRHPHKSLPLFLLVIIAAYSLVSLKVLTTKSYAAGITASIRNDGMILINTTPRFLFGFYQDGDDAAHQGSFLLTDLTTIADADFNLMHLVITELSNTTAYRQTAPTRGIYTIAQFYQPSLVSTVTSLKNDESIFAWDIGDDFNIPANDPSKTPAIYQAKADQIKSIAPNHLTYGAGTGFPGYPLTTYQNALDIIGIEAYPIGNLDGSYQTEMEESIEYYINARQQLPGHAILALPQTFAWSGGRLPDATEIRNMTFGALIARMNGILYYSYYCCGIHVPDTTMWGELKKIKKDTNVLTNPLLNGAYSSYDEGPTTRNGSIHAAFWQYQGKTYVLAVNTAKTARTATIALPQGVNGTITPLFPGDSRYETNLSLTGSTLTGSMANYSVGAYIIQNTTLPPTQPQRILSFSAALDGIGLNENTTPLSTTRPVTVEYFLQPTSQPNATSSGTMIYNPSSGKFEGTTVLPQLPDNSYLVRIKSPGYFKTLLPGFITTTSSQSNYTLSTTFLQSGDVTGDDIADIFDYNIIVDCYSDLLTARACDDPTKKLSADLNDDGRVQGVDINLFLRTVHTRSGS